MCFDHLRRIKLIRITRFNLSKVIMTRRDLDATDRILWDFVSGHLIHLHLCDGSSQKYGRLWDTSYRCDDHLCDRSYRCDNR
jgi:hypothetical protein